MQQKYFFYKTVYTIFITSMCFVNVLSIQQERQHQQRNNEISSTSTIANGASLAYDNKNKQQRTWLPMSHNNLIIMKAAKINVATDTASSAATTFPNNHRLKSSHSLAASAPEQQQQHQEQQQQLKYKFWHKEQQAYPAHLPTNYYTYNQSSKAGSYQPQTAMDVKLIEPYIVTISKMRAHNEPLLLKNPVAYAMFSHRNAQGNLKSAFGVSSPYVGAIKLLKDVVSDVTVANPKITSRQDIKKEQINNMKHNFANTIETSSSSSTANFADENFDNKHNIDEEQEQQQQQQREFIIEEMKTDGAQINEIFQPLENTLDKIISFCDMAKQFISDTDGNETEGVNDVDDEDDAANDEDEINLFNTKPTKTALEKVQGHHVLSVNKMSTLTSSKSQAAQSRASTTALSSSIGTGRKHKKLKKKLSKFMLPLLLAYKLKFLTLIPVLIGGLTLLVGTTGLAGFFFALFTAVMSLKSTGSSKSIIVKKI